MDVNKRSFFGGKDDKAKEAKEEESADDIKKEEGKDAKQEANKEGKKSSSSDSSSSDESDVDLTKEDIDKIKKLITEQDDTIAKHEKELERLEKEVKKWKQELIYQRAENDNTIKRYRLQIEEGKQFAISKFAKELLDVRDNLALALEHVDVEKLNATEDIDMLKVQM